MTNDYGGYRQIVQEAREIDRELQARPPEACPYDGTPLEYNARLVMWNCPMGDYRTTLLRRPSER